MKHIVWIGHSQEHQQYRVELMIVFPAARIKTMVLNNQNAYTIQNVMQLQVLLARIIKSYKNEI